MTKLEFVKRLNNLKKGIKQRSNLNKVLSELEDLGFTVEYGKYGYDNDRMSFNGKYAISRTEKEAKMLKIKELDIDIDTKNYQSVNLVLAIKEAIYQPIQIANKIL